MKDNEKDVIEEVKAIGEILSVVDQDATVQPETINRIGELITELCQSVL